MESTGFIRRSLFAVAGLLVWAFHFTTVYVLNALACARNFDQERLLGFGLVPLLVGLATVLAVGAVILILALALRRSAVMRDDDDPAAGFLRHLTVSVCLLSIVAICWTGFPALFVTPCG